MAVVDGPFNGGYAGRITVLISPLILCAVVVVLKRGSVTMSGWLTAPFAAALALWAGIRDETDSCVCETPSILLYGD